MRGFVRQRSEGSTFTAYWTVLDPSSGRRRQFSKGGFPTKSAAQKHLNVVVGKVTEGGWQPDQAITVAQLLQEHWIPAQRARGLRPSTLAMYEGASSWYLIPTLGARKVAALTPADVSSLVEHMRTAKSASGRSGLSARTVQIAVSTLKSATSWANRNGLLGRDPLVGIERPRLSQAAMKSWSEAQARDFLAAVKGGRLEAGWALLLTRGLRRGELAGLRWDAIDLAEGTIQIVRSRVSVDGKALDSAPKTAAGRRTVPVDPQLVSLLRAHEKAQKTERLRAGEAWEGAGHVFTDELGRPYHPDYFGCWFEELVKSAGLPRIRLHDLRHTCFSLMLGRGVPAKVVQELAGHSSPAITLSMYAHTQPSMARNAGAALSASLLS